MCCHTEDSGADDRLQVHQKCESENTRSRPRGPLNFEDMQREFVLLMLLTLVAIIDCQWVLARLWELCAEGGLRTAADD